MKEKRILIIGMGVISILCLLIGMTSLINNKFGDASKVTITKVSSKKYSNEEIKNATSVAIDYFEKYYKGCTLTNISYIGDEQNNEYIDWAKRNNKGGFNIKLVY